MPAHIDNKPFIQWVISMANTELHNEKVTRIPGEAQLCKISEKFVQLLGKCFDVVEQWYGVSPAVRRGWNEAVSSLYGPGLWFVQSKSYESESHKHLVDFAEACRAAFDFLNHDWDCGSVCLQRINYNGDVVEEVQFELDAMESGCSYSEDEYEELSTIGGPVVQLVNQLLAGGFPVKCYDDDDDHYELIPRPVFDWVPCYWKIVGVTPLLSDTTMFYKIVGDFPS